MNVLDLVCGFGGVIVGSRLFRPVIVLVVRPFKGFIDNISEKPGGPGKYWTNFGITVITLLILAAAAIDTAVVWSLASWGCAKWNFDHAKALWIGALIGSLGSTPTYWIFACAGFGNACSMADSRARQKRERSGGFAQANVATDVSKSKDVKPGE